MFAYVLKIVLISIGVSLFATWIKLIPRYPNWKYRLIREGSNTGILTVLLTVMVSFQIEVPWVLLFGIMLGILGLSVLIADRALRRDQALAAAAAGSANGA